MILVLATASTLRLLAVPARIPSCRRCSESAPFREMACRILRDGKLSRTSRYTLFASDGGFLDHSFHDNEKIEGREGTEKNHPRSVCFPRERHQDERVVRFTIEFSSLIISLVADDDH